MSLVAAAFIKVIQHDGLFVRLKRSPPRVPSVQSRRKDDEGRQAWKNTHAERAAEFVHHRNLSKRIATSSVPRGHSEHGLAWGMQVRRWSNSVFLLDHFSTDTQGE